MTYHDHRANRGLHSILLPLFFIVSTLVMGCNKPKETVDIVLVDPQATNETYALFENLNELRTSKVLLGHQDDLAYGVNWAYVYGNSDVKEVSGSYPAVYGWDLGHIELDSTRNLDKVPFDSIRSYMQQAYRRGGINTISWHLNNPYNGNSSWDTTHTIQHLLPGGQAHSTFNTYLDRLANFLDSVKDDQNRPIPIIFRPWHEHTGHWFWWSAKFSKGDEYQQLWRYTVTYLRDQKNLHHLLYAYSPSNTNIEKMWDSYPGDEWVDIIGFDDYFGYHNQPDSLRDSAKQNDLKGFTERITMIVNEAEKRGKIPAITETGLEALRDSTWFTSFLLNALSASETNKRMAYVLVWRNANNETDRKEHFYAPYKGHASENDFIQFTKDPLILLESGLPNMYQRKN